MIDKTRWLEVETDKIQIIRKTFGSKQQKDYPSLRKVMMVRVGTHRSGIGSVRVDLDEACHPRPQSFLEAICKVFVEVEVGRGCMKIPAGAGLPYPLSTPRRNRKRPTFNLRTTQA